MDLLLYHWPRFIPALLFVLYSLRIVKDKYSLRQQIGLGIVLFFISGPIVSIFSEILSSWFFAVLFESYANASSASYFGVRTLFSLFYDSIAYVIPLMIYARIIDISPVIAATWYVEYVLQDRFA